MPTPLPKILSFALTIFWLDYNACHINIIKAFDSVSHSSPMHSFHHCINHTKHNLINWRVSGIRSIDFELSNLESEIRTVEEREILSPDPWHRIWLHSLRNRHSALLRQNSIFGFNVLDCNGLIKGTSPLASSIVLLKLGRLNPGSILSEKMMVTFLLPFRILKIILLLFIKICGLLPPPSP